MFKKIWEKRHNKTRALERRLEKLEKRVGDEKKSYGLFDQLWRESMLFGSTAQDPITLSEKIERLYRYLGLSIHRTEEKIVVSKIKKVNKNKK